MATKKQTCFRLSDSMLMYISEYKEQNHLSSQTQALELIIEEHKAASLKQTDAVANKVIEAIEKKYGNAFTRIRLATRTADINSQVILEIFNSMLQSSAMPNAFVPTDTLKHEIIDKSEEAVKSRIAYYKQKNDNKKKGNKNDNA